MNKGLYLLIAYCIVSFVLINAGLITNNIYSFKLLEKAAIDGSIKDKIGHNDVEVERENGVIKTIRVKSGLYTRENNSWHLIPIPIFLLLSTCWFCSKTIKSALGLGSVIFLLFLLITLLTNSVFRYLNGANFRPSLTCFVSSFVLAAVIFFSYLMTVNKKNQRVPDLAVCSEGSIRIVYDYNSNILKYQITLLTAGLFVLSYKIINGLNISAPILEDSVQYYSIAIVFWATAGFGLGVIMPQVLYLNKIVEKVSDGTRNTSITSE